MSLSGIIIIAMLLLGIAAPFIALYAASLAKKKNYSRHKQTHKILFTAMAALVIVFEMTMIFSKNSGFLPENNPYLGTTFFSTLLTAHIIGAVLTFVIWGSILFISSWKFKKGISGSFFKAHKTVGYITIAGLFYTAVTAVAITTIAFVI